MRTRHSIAPIFGVRDVEAALAHYRRLGFKTREYSGGGYGFAARDGVEIHLGLISEPGARTARSSAYLTVGDADALAGEWVAAGVEIHPPEDTEWGMREGAHVDPDDNVIRFGSPLEPSDQAARTTS
jgi:hypothetical protein